MGTYSVAAEEKAVEDALAQGQVARRRHPTPDAVAADDDDPWLELHPRRRRPPRRHHRRGDRVGAHHARDCSRRMPPTSPPRSRRSSRPPPHRRPRAASSGASTPATDSSSSAPPTTCASACGAAAGLSRRPPGRRRHEARDHAARSRRRSLKEARDDRSNQKGLWPEAHYLGPLHPVLDWAGDRTLARLGRDEVFVVRGDVFAPTVLVLGSLTNERGQVIATNLVAVSGTSVQPFADAAEAFDELGVTARPQQPLTRGRRRRRCRSSSRRPSTPPRSTCA